MLFSVYLMFLRYTNNQVVILIENILICMQIARYHRIILTTQNKKKEVEYGKITSIPTL